MSDPRSTIEDFAKNSFKGMTLGIDPLTSNLIGAARRKPNNPQVPTVTPPVPMPIPGQDDLSNIAATRRSIADQLLRRGRLSTILTQNTEPLGG